MLRIILKNKITILFGILLFLLASFLIYKVGVREVNKKQVPQLKENSPTEILEKMSLRDKVGQMLMIGFWGEKPDYYVNKMIDEHNIGGVVLTDYNLKQKDQTIKLVNGLQSRSLQTDLGIPLFVSVDQEGGEITRVDFAGVEEKMGQPEIDSTEEAFSIAKKRAEELRNLGIYVNYSPVLDYITEDNSFLYNRTFNGNLADISKLGSSMVEGYQKGGVISVPKHFPGYTNKSSNSHKKLPESNLEKEEVMARIKPFRQVIKESSPRMVMSTHIIYNNIDSSDPASLSKKFISDILKDDLDYKGLIITDYIEMRGLLSNYSVSESAVEAIKAGNDILIYSSIPEKQAEAYRAIINAVENGDISVDNINKSVIKILELKKEVYY